ncbi:hypothetical protein HD806DRAFT_254667 [Xylariaceae sp. AK1471]|nr:hypothetical protein HD806DRAFT_254667 [Xylariaceae sp. AK1471]
MELFTEEQGSQEMVQSTSKSLKRSLDQMQSDQLQPVISGADSLEVFSQPVSGASQQSFDFNMFGLDFTMRDCLSPTSNFFSFWNDPFPLNPSPQLSPPYPLAQLCPHGHNHSPWPRKGPLEIQKCETRCDFCGLVLKTAAGLRKHAYGHKEKDGLDIEIVPGSSGRKRRALLPEGPNYSLNDHGISEGPGSVDTSLAKVHQSQGATKIQESAVKAVDGEPLGFDEAVTLVRQLRRENAQLKAENQALKSKIEVQGNIDEDKEPYKDQLQRFKGRFIHIDLEADFRLGRRDMKMISISLKGEKAVELGCIFKSSKIANLYLFMLVKASERRVLYCDLGAHKGTQWEEDWLL